MLTLQVINNFAVLLPKHYMGNDNKLLVYILQHVWWGNTQDRDTMVQLQGHRDC